MKPQTTQCTYQTTKPIITTGFCKNLYKRKVFAKACCCEQTDIASQPSPAQAPRRKREGLFIVGKNQSEYSIELRKACTHE